MYGDADILVYFGPEPWSGMWRNRHHLLSRLARKRRVVYVEPKLGLKALRRRVRAGEISWLDVFKDFFNRPDTMTDNGVVVHRAPLWTPVLGRRGLRWLSLRLWLHTVSKTLKRIGGGVPKVWFSRPHMLDYLDHLATNDVTYHVVDEYLAYAREDPHKVEQQRQVEDALLNKANRVIVVSPALQTTKQAQNANTYLVPNGVDFDLYDQVIGDEASKPEELLALSGPILGYSGLISSRLRLDWFLHIAKAHPSWQLVFVGDVNPSNCEKALDDLRALANVYFLGVKDISELPAYVNTFDVCLVPYADSEETRSLSPLKMYDYMALGKPVVSSVFPAAKNFQDLIYLANSEVDFVRQIGEALNEHNSELFDKRRQMAQTNSWDKRVLQIEDILTAKPNDCISKVLFYAPDDDGGAAVILRDLVIGMDRTRYESSVVFAQKSGAKVIHDLQEANIPVRFVNNTPRGVMARRRPAGSRAERIEAVAGSRLADVYASLRGAWRFLRRDFGRARRLARMFSKRRADIVHVNGLRGGEVAVVAARMAGIPCVMHIHMFTKINGFDRLLSRWCQHSLYISNAIREHCEKQNWRSKQSVVLSNGVDIDAFSPNPGDRDFRQRWLDRDTDVLVGVIGRIVPWKGQDVFVRAMAELVEEEERVCAVIIGEPGRDQSDDFLVELKTLAIQLGLRDKIKFVGQHRDMPAIVNSLDILVHCSSKPEPFGLVIIEGMACGKPVIATGAGGVLDIIRDGEDGLVVPPGSVAAMSDALKQLIRQPALAKKMGERARCAVTERFSLQQQVNNLQGVYESLAGDTL